MKRLAVALFTLTGAGTITAAWWWAEVGFTPEEGYASLVTLSVLAIAGVAAGAAS